MVIGWSPKSFAMKFVFPICAAHFSHLNPLTWYGHVQRMAEGRLPKIALKWMPKQKRAWGRLKKNWMEGIKKAMNEKNLHEGQWEDKKQWSLGFGQRRKTFWNRYMYIVVRNFLVGLPTVIVLMRTVYHGIGVLGSLLFICMGSCYIVFCQDIF